MIALPHKAPWVVGQYVVGFNTAAAADLPCGDILLFDGLTRHIRKRHPGCVGYMDYIPDIIAAPDYIGRNPREPDSIELIKAYGENIQLAIKLDTKNGYLYVASLYEVSQGKLLHRLAGGRIKPYP